MEINVLVDEGLKECPEAGWLESVAKKVLITQNVDSKTEIDLAIVSQERISQLNFSYLGKDEPTDVMAFSMLPEQPDGEIAPFVLPPDGIKRLGEVIVSYHQAVIQAEERRHSTKREIAILIIHGVLHLLGYDHDKLEPAHQMRVRETEVLNCIDEELE